MWSAGSHYFEWQDRGRQHSSAQQIIAWAAPPVRAADGGQRRAGQRRAATICVGHTSPPEAGAGQSTNPSRAPTPPITTPNAWPGVAGDRSDCDEILEINGQPIGGGLAHGQVVRHIQEVSKFDVARAPL